MAFDVEGARQAGYSDTEIADHLAETSKFDAAAARKAGYSDAELIKQLADQPPAAPPPTVVQAGARGLGLGVRDVIEGATALPGMLLDAATYPGRALNRLLNIPTTAPSDLVRKGEDVIGLPKPETPGERLRSAVVQPVAGTLSGVGIGGALEGAASPVVQTVGRALAQQPVTQAVAGATGGAVGEVTDSPTAGLLTGALLPLAKGGVGAAARSVTGSGVSQGDAALGQLARGKYNIDVTAPDLSRNQFYRNVYDQTGKLPFSGAGKAYDTKIGQWQGAIANEMGEPNTTAFTPDVMSRAKARIGQQFDDVATRTSIPSTETPTLLSDLQGILPDARQVLTEAELKPLELQIQNIAERIGQGNGTISGDAYQALTRTKAPLDLAESSTNPNVAHFAGKIRDALDDAFVRSAAPADQEALRQAKYQYRVMRTIDPLVAGSRDGSITPDAFMQKVLTASRRFDSPTGGMAYTGGGNIGELARIGKLFRAAPQTGSADRAMVNFGTGVGVGGSGLAALFHPSVLLGVPATLTANRLLQAGLRSGPVAEQAINTALGPRQSLLNQLAIPAITAADVALQNRARQSGQD